MVRGSLLPVATLSRHHERLVAHWFVKSSRFGVPGFNNLWRPEMVLRVAADPKALWTAAGDADGEDWR